MKPRFSACIAGLTLLAAFAALGMPVRLAAQEKKDHKHHHYQLIDTGTLGGPTSSLGFEGERDLNNRGVLVSVGDTALPDPYAPNCFLDCFLAHTVEWQNGVLADFGALPSVNNSGPIWITDGGLIAGLSDNGVIDPLTGFPEFRAVLWQDGNIMNLGTLGGNESVAGGVNDRGQVSGCANNGTSDSFNLGCVGSPQQGRAFLWRNGVMEDLGTLGGPDSSGGPINERGEVAGWALLNSTPNPTTGIPTQHPFLWQNGIMHDLGTIGGTAVFEVNGLNNHSQVVGGMNVAGDQSFHPFLWDGQSIKDLGTLGGIFGNADWLTEAGAVVGWSTTPGDLAAHAFLWRHGKMADLGVNAGNLCSIAYVINTREQVVGGSDDCSGNNPLAFVWEKGSIADLNGLVVNGVSVQLTVAVGLNEAGEIAAQGVVSNGDLHAFLLVPCDENHPGIEDCDYSMVEVSATPSAAPAQHYQNLPVPAGMMNPALRRFGGRLHPWSDNLIRQTTPSDLTSKPASGLSAASVVNDEKLDELLNPQFCWRPPCQSSGYCEVDFTGKLTGGCVGSKFFRCFIGSSKNCPTGKRAKHETVINCNQFPDRIDLARKCTF